MGCEVPGVGRPSQSTSTVSETARDAICGARVAGAVSVANSSVGVSTCRAELVLILSRWSHGSSTHGTTALTAWIAWRVGCPRYRVAVVVPGEGLEPPTFGLQNRCTTAVLTRRRASETQIR